MTYVIVHLAVWLLSSHLIPQLIPTIVAFRRSMGYVALTAAILWLLYVACEPIVRRRWPRALVSWSRLLAGRFLDPQVGRDVLLGCLLGGLWLLLMSLYRWLPLWLGWPAPLPSTAGITALGDVSRHIAWLLETPLDALFQSMTAMFLFAMLRIVLRNQWLAVVALGVIYALVLGGGSEYPQITLPVFFTMGLLWALTVIRFGYLASAVLVTVVFALKGPTINLAAWYGIGTATALAFATALALYGFRISQGTNPARSARKAVP